MKKIIILVLTLTLYTTATIRYVKAGNPTPLSPYTSWATAADSIWKALRISVSGDTVFVGNGIYKETDTLPAGVSLIGSGIDSCIWDLSKTRSTSIMLKLEKDFLSNILEINLRSPQNEQTKETIYS